MGPAAPLSRPGNRIRRLVVNGTPRRIRTTRMEWRRWIYAIPARLKAVFRTRRVEEDLHDELAFHVAMQARANEQEGLTERDAYRRARVDIGGVEQVKERSRDIR